jgi:hypothetical protein
MVANQLGYLGGLPEIYCGCEILHQIVTTIGIPMKHCKFHLVLR